MSSATIKLLAWLISAFGLAATFGIATYASAGLSWVAKADGLLLFVWAVLPYALLSLSANIAHCHKSSIVVLATAAISLVFAALVYIDAFFIHSDAQSALAFLFVPLLQNGLSITLLLVVIVGWLRANSHTSNSSFKRDALKRAP